MVYLELPSELTCHSKCECKLETRFPSLTLFFRSICHEPLQGYRHLWMCFLTLWCNEILQALTDSSFLSGLCSMSSFWGLTPPSYNRTAPCRISTACITGSVGMPAGQWNPLFGNITWKESLSCSEMVIRRFRLELAGSQGSIAAHPVCSVQPPYSGQTH